MKAQRYKEIVDYLLDDVLPDEFDSTPSNFRREAANYALDEKARLYRNNKPVVKWGERKEIYDAFHRHQGRTRTWQLISERYYWRGGYQYVAQQVKDCVACAHKNNSSWPASFPPLQPISIIPKVFHRVHVDILGSNSPLKITFYPTIFKCSGPLEQTINGNQYIAIAVCAFTKYVEAQGNSKIKMHIF